MNELKNAAVINCAKSNGIPVKRIKIDVKKWNPGGVARGSPPMWYGFQRGSFPSSRIRFMMLPCSPMSELGGYSLWKITAALKRNAKLNMAKSSRVLLCLVVNHHWNEYNYLSIERNLLLSQNTNPLSPNHIRSLITEDCWKQPFFWKIHKHKLDTKVVEFILGA